MESGDVEDLFEIIPRIGVLRDKRFHEPLISMLLGNDIKRKEFAAYAMGAIGERDFLEPLKSTFLQSWKKKGFGAHDFLVAVIEAIGAIGDDEAAEFFLPILKESEGGKAAKRRKWIVESLGAIAQQGGRKSLEALLEVTYHKNPDLRALALSELSVAYWHRPNEIEDSILSRIFDLTSDSNPVVAESAREALQSLADVGCLRAEKLFPQEDQNPSL